MGQGGGGGSQANFRWCRPASWRRHFTEEQLWDVLIGIAQGLQHIHRARILHRDIKPSNIFLDHKGRVKIGDFGLGRILGPQVVPHATLHA